MMEIETEEPSKKYWEWWATKLNTQIGCNLPWVGMAFRMNIVNFILVVINTCRSIGSVAMLGALKDSDKAFGNDNHGLEGSC